MPNVRNGLMNNSGTEDDHQQALARALDVVPACLAMFSFEGALTFANQPMIKLWCSPVDGVAVRSKVEQLAHSVCRALPAFAMDPRNRVREIETNILRTAAKSYRLRGSYIAIEFFGRGNTVLVSVEAIAPDPQVNEALARRLGLTEREMHVAALLADGKSNAGIAAELFISPHTARTHTERVLRKLGARSRAEVGAILRRS